MKRPNPITMLMTALLVLGASGVLLANQMNERIESSAKQSYVFQTYLKDDAINIQATDDSVVTLTGTVSEWSHRSLAEETVTGLPGVKRVDNQLAVAGGPPDLNSDAWIGTKVRTVLMFHQHLSSLNADVEVKAGIVTLRGHASSQAQKELATEYVKDVAGVMGVYNEMTVKKPGKTAIEKAAGPIDDASIKAQVKLELLFHSSTSAMKTEVEVNDGIVTVRGIAKNDAERDLVGKLVNNVKGVKGLNNLITIE